jgi:surface polysaccharide O-acyltransferase-like enzyme
MKATNPAEHSPQSKNTRFAYLDNLRSFVIILVVAQHAAITYSGIGGWYYREVLQENLNIVELTVFGILQSFNQAWFMGILFFISAFLATKSLNKRGPKVFIKERLFRLGIPLLFYMFIIAPLINFIIFKNDSITWLYIKNRYLNYLSTFTWLGSTGPLWFAEVLLVFCGIYALVRHFFPTRKGNNTNIFTVRNMLCIILLTTVIAFLVRLWFPVGTGISNLQFPFFPSYIILFILGIMTGERQLFDALSAEKNIKWFKAALLIGIPLWSIIMIFGGPIEGKMLIYGGMNWQSFAFALWESFVAIGFSVGLIALFKKYINIDNKFTKLLAENVFGIYVFHAPILVALSLALKWWIMSPLIKTIVLMLCTLTICFLFSMVIRKIKPIKVLLR